MFLKNLREKAGKKQIDVYKKLRIDRGTFRKLESGNVSLKAEWIPILSNLYGVSQIYIYQGYVKEKKVLKPVDEQMMNIISNIEFFLKSNGDNSAKKKGDVQ